MIYGIRFNETDHIDIVEYYENEILEALEVCYAVCKDKDNAIELSEILQERLR